MQRRRRDLRAGAAAHLAARARGVLAASCPGSVAGRDEGVRPACREPHDWVTRAADDVRTRSTTARSGRRSSPAPRARARPGPVHLGNLREFLTVHFVAEEIRRRGHRRPAPAQLGRLRPVPQGPGRRRPVLVRAHRPAAVRRARPVAATSRWAEHFKAPLRDALPSWASRWTRSPRPRGTAPAPTASGPHRRAPPRRDRGGAGPLPHQGGRAGVRPTTTTPPTSGATGDLARFPYKPYCRDCGRDTTTITAYDDETTDLSYTCDFAATRRHQPRHATSRASWSGRSTGRCAGRSRASTSSPPASTTRPPARRSPSGRSWS